MKFVKGIPNILKKLINGPVHYNLNLYYQNFRGLLDLSKLNVLMNNAFDYDFIGFPETWLPLNVNMCELGLPNYNTYLYVCNLNTSNSSRGVRVLQSVNNKFHSRLLSVPDSQVEHLFVILKLIIVT